METLQFFSTALFRIKGSFFPPPQDVFLPASCHLPPFEVSFTSCGVSRRCFQKGVLLLCLYTSWLFRKAACYWRCGGRLQELHDGHCGHHHPASTRTHTCGLAELIPIRRPLPACVHTSGEPPTKTGVEKLSHRSFVLDDARLTWTATRAGRRCLLLPREAYAAPRVPHRPKMEASPPCATQTALWPVVGCGPLALRTGKPVCW